MQFPQPGIFAVGTRSHHHLEFDVSTPVASAWYLAPPIDLLRGLTEG